MSDHYIQLNCVTVGEEVEKSKPSENLGATSLPQTPQQNYQITQNIVIQATPIQNDNRNNKALVYQEKNNTKASSNKCCECCKEPLPKGYLKAIILNYLFFILCLIDIIIQSSLEITNSVNIFSNIYNMIFSIIFLIILHAKVDPRKPWIFFFPIFIVFLILFGVIAGSHGLVQNLSQISEKCDDNDENIFYIIFIAIFAIKMLIIFFIIISYMDISYDACYN